MRKSKSSSARIDNPRLFRWICNPLQVTAQERKSTSFGGFQIRKEIGRTFFVCGFQIRRNAYGGLKPPLVSADLQSAASYLFRICNPLQVTAQERKSTSFGGFQIRKEIGRTFFVCGFQIRRNAYGGLKPPLVSVDLQSAGTPTED